jgi:hypothetical protein
MTSNPSIYFEEPAGPHPYGGVRTSQTDSIFSRSHSHTLWDKIAKRAGLDTYEQKVLEYKRLCSPLLFRYAQSRLAHCPVTPTKPNSLFKPKSEPNNTGFLRR